MMMMVIVRYILSERSVSLEKRMVIRDTKGGGRKNGKVLEGPNDE